jgi:hypothetical protein
MSQTPSTGVRRILPRLQFRIRSLVIGITIVAVALAPVRAEIARCQALAALADQITRCQGEVFFDYQLIEEGVVLRQLESDQPGWIRSALGAHALADVVEIRLEGKRPHSAVFGKIGQNCPNLLHLFLSASNVSDASLKSIANCKLLQHLDLSSASVTDEGLMHFAGHEHLSTLCLENCQISGASFLMLSQLKSLKILALDNTSVDDNDIARLADSATIDMLFLAGTEVTDDVISHLARMPSLKSVSLSRTKVTMQGRSKLRKLRPEINQM